MITYPVRNNLKTFLDLGTTANKRAKVGPKYKVWEPEARINLAMQGNLRSPSQTQSKNSPNKVNSKMKSLRARDHKFTYAHTKASKSPPNNKI